jgi:hypothetical protein
LNSGPSPWATPPALFCDGFFLRDRISWTICSGWLQTVILQLSASWIAKILRVSRCHLAWINFLFTGLRDRDLISVFYTWISNFLKTTGWRDWLYSPRFCWKSYDSSYVGLFWDLLFFSIDLGICFCVSTQAVFVTMAR